MKQACRLRPSVVTRDQLGRICKKLGIVTRGLKVFRHCSATFMDQENIPIVVRQERLGHRPGSKVTMVHYTHSVPAGHKAAAETVGQILAS